ncbi:hypothetical protein [Caldimonas sp. KR1-144]|uniref:hypothetical protein n=1 Tax=Caldimonas sp. KR1-144 TaxID=3400911 RepID=UPI003C107C33
MNLGRFNLKDWALDPCLHDHRGGRAQRFMESSDINAAFDELFFALRRNIRRGMTSEGQVYAIEMDACIPGELLGTSWVPAASRGLADVRVPAARHALFERLLRDSPAEPLVAYVCEHDAADGTVLYVEIASADGLHVAEYPIRAGRGWHRRELLRATHRRATPSPTVSR